MSIFNENFNIKNNNIANENSIENYNFKSDLDLIQEYNENEDLEKSDNKLSNNPKLIINNESNKKFNSKNNLATNNLSIDLISSKSTEFSSLIKFQLNPNSEKIYDNIYKNKKINNSIIILDDEETYIELFIKLIEDFDIENYKEIRDKNKICFLIVDSKKIDKLFERLNEIFGKQKKIMILQGGKGKKMKNDYNKFCEFIQNNDIFISIPDVFYKLLSIGFLKIEQFSILFIDDCHLCEGNHPYNIIMQEFYYYYIYKINNLHFNKIYSLPNIIGFTNSTIIDKRIIKNNNICKQLLSNISENLDSQIIISPKILYNSSNENNIDIEYFQIVNNLSDKNNFEKYKMIYDILHHYFFIKMLKLSLKNYLSQNQTVSFGKEKINQLCKNYLDFVKQKFFANNYEEYIKMHNNDNNLKFISRDSYIFQIFEEMQKYLILILQNTDLQGMINLLNNYLNLFKNILIKKEKEEIQEQNMINEIKQLIVIITDTINAFNSIVQKNFNFNNYRLNKFLSFINSLYSKNKICKIIIFVSSRKIAYILNEYLNRNNMFKSDYIAGVNSKNNDNLFFSISKKITNNIINERNKKFINGEINILICTPSVYDNIQIKKCDYIIIYNELSKNNCDYIRIKNLAFQKTSKLIAFTQDKTKLNNIFLEKDLEHDNILTTLFESKNIVKDFRNKNYLEKKIENLEKQNYYIIEETQAKISNKNSMMLFNEMNNWFLQNNIKLINNKFIDEIYIDKIKKYKCKIELNEMFGGAKIFSHLFGDKQTSEAECILQLISFLHKKRILDNNLKIIEKLK